MIAILAAIGMVVTFTLVVTTRKIKRSFPIKYMRRNDIREHFTAFAQSNCSQTLSTATVARFMHDTADTSNYFSSTAILNMRNALQDNAQLLIYFQNLESDPISLTEVRSELDNHKNITKQWFEESIVRIEALFAAEIILHPTASDIWRELLDAIRRATRA